MTLLKKQILPLVLVLSLLAPLPVHAEEQLSKENEYSVMGGKKKLSVSSEADYYVEKYGEEGKDGAFFLNDRLCIKTGESLDVESGQYVDLILESGETVPCIVSGIDYDCEKAVSSVVADSSKSSLSLSKIDKKWKGAVTGVVTYEENFREEIGLGEDIALYAKQFLGNPYVWGGESLTDGADCSGFVMALYSRYGIYLPHDAEAQSGYGVAVSEAEMQPGDLVFYSEKEEINHVSLYIGEGLIIHASNPNDGIKISMYNYRQPCCIRRLF